MDSAADSLLALSNTAAALAAADEPGDDDDRSSSLSELDGLDAPEIEITEPTLGLDGDSEAETERLEESPDKITQRKQFEVSPSKLAQSSHVDDRPEIESLTESAISSPISSGDESLDDDALSDAPVADDEAADEQLNQISPSKRKRQEDEADTEGQGRLRRRRTGSVVSDDAKSDAESDEDIARDQPTREATIEVDPDVIDEPEDEIEEDDEQADNEKLDGSEDSKGKKRAVSNRSQRRRGKDDDVAEAEPEAEDEVDVGEESDEVDVDDAEAAAKSEEEQAKKIAAMEALTALEKHFATLRDRLYDERIAALNHELALLAESKPSHPELLRQLECVRKYRDDKFEVEQKLLVYKTGALKNKSVAERAQIHSAYFQTIRDIREKHLERISEHFYRIQRDRFKSESTVPNYTIPFADRRSQQILQQTAYNKEVSILSGVAKYVGFPAAPELPPSHQKELDEDMQKMGISLAHLRSARAPAKSSIHSAFNTTISAPAAEEQFLEQNPWANPQHPYHRLGINRQNSNPSALAEVYQTPVNLQRVNSNVPAGSASTIPENPSAPASSALNTPHDQQSSQTKAEPQVVNNLQNYRLNSVSPLESRKTSSAAMAQSNGERADQRSKDQVQEPASSPLSGRNGLAHSASAIGASTLDKMPRHNPSSSPFPIGKDGAITAGSGYMGAGRFSVR